jgi:predicted aminopeptidase
MSADALPPYSPPGAPAAGALASAALLVFACGCQAGYVIEQGVGHLRLAARRVPLDSPSLAEQLGAAELEKLTWVPRALEFARDELGLEPGDAYTSYVDTAGEPVSHVVVASHPLALEAYEWCFPVAGCVPYKGFFDREDALAEARRLAASGYDVAVLPVEAYSTLGWFSDPVISTMLERPLPALIDTLLHESTHRSLYFPGRPELNEGLATHVAREGTRRFLEAHPELIAAGALEEHDRLQAADDEYAELLARLRRDLEVLYRGPLSNDEKLRRKREILATAGNALAELRHRQGHGNERPARLSNAHVLASASYHEALPALRRLERESGGHPRALMRSLREAYARDPDLPEQLLRREDRR